MENTSTMIAATEAHELARLDCLALEARTYCEALAMNIFQLGRVYVEAKRMVKHGEWTNWLRENGGMSERLAQDCMGVYERYGNLPDAAKLEKSKLFKMLALPRGTEEQFLAEHDVASMTTREVAEAVKEARREMQEKLDAEKLKREAAEARAAELENRPPELPDDYADQLEKRDAELIRMQNEVKRAGDIASEAIAEQRRLSALNNEISGELEDANAMLAQQQEDYDRLQADMLSARSAAAKGDAERTVTADFTPEMFANAVRQFVGACARMPHMAAVFSRMDAAELEAYEECLCTVESWAKGARKALDVLPCDEVVI